jgi:hypothetical protein
MNKIIEIERIAGDYKITDVVKGESIEGNRFVKYISVYSNRGSCLVQVALDRAGWIETFSVSLTHLNEKEKAFVRAVRRIFLIDI